MDWRANFVGVIVLVDQLRKTGKKELVLMVAELLNNLNGAGQINPDLEKEHWLDLPPFPNSDWRR